MTYDMLSKTRFLHDLQLFCSELKRNALNAVIWVMPDTVLQRILSIKPHGMFATIIAAAQTHAQLMISLRQKKEAESQRNMVKKPMA